MTDLRHGLLAFLGANAIKIADGGWLPLVIGVGLLTVMTTWKTGRRLVAERLVERAVPMREFLAQIAANPPSRVPGTAVFMTGRSPLRKLSARRNCF
jgi:KUP system potassium uptake protein